MRKSQRVRKQAAAAKVTNARRSGLHEEDTFWATKPNMRSRTSVNGRMIVLSTEDRPLAGLALVPGAIAQTSIICPPKPKGSKPASTKLNGWDEVASRFDEDTRKGAMVRSSEIHEPIGPAFREWATDSPSSTAAQLRANVIGACPTNAVEILPANGQLTKGDRNWVVLAENGGDLTPIMATRRASVIPQGLVAGWGSQNHLKPCWDE